MARTRSKRSKEETRAKARILVVEDEIFVAWHLESVLHDLDYAVCGMVPDGASAVEKMDDGEADLVLMDINLKGDIDGVETARRIRENGEAPIIFITAYSDAQTLSRIEKAIPGAPVLAKPVAPARLRTAIERLLEGRLH
jgi:CheY-like chemotaxis protein